MLASSKIRVINPFGSPKAILRSFSFSPSEQVAPGSFISSNPPTPSRETTPIASDPSRATASAARNDIIIRAQEALLALKDSTSTSSSPPRSPRTHQVGRSMLLQRLFPPRYPSLDTQDMDEGTTVTLDL